MKYKFLCKWCHFTDLFTLRIFSNSSILGKLAPLWDVMGLKRRRQRGEGGPAGGPSKRLLLLSVFSPSKKKWIHVHFFTDSFFTVIILHEGNAINSTEDPSKFYRILLKVSWSWCCGLIWKKRIRFSAETRIQSSLKRYVWRVHKSTLHRDGLFFRKQMSCHSMVTSVNGGKFWCCAQDWH